MAIGSNDGSLRLFKDSDARRAIKLYNKIWNSIKHV